MNIRIVAMGCALALSTSGFVVAQNANANGKNGSATVTASDVEGGQAKDTKNSDTKNVRRARRAVPNQPQANTPGQGATAHDINNPRNGTNAQVAGSPSGTAELGVSSAEAHKNSDKK